MSQIICFQRVFEFIKKNVIYKKNFICKEKSGAVKKVRELRNLISFILVIWYQSNDKLSRKVMSVSYTKNEKHLSKQAVPITYALERRMFVAAFFKGLWVVSFQTKQENAWHTLVFLSLFCIYRGKEDEINTA